MTEKVEEQLSMFKEWFRKQPHFPKKIDDILIVRFLHSCYYDVENAKKTANKFFEMRATCPDLFANRDPTGPDIQNAIQFSKMAQYSIAGNKFLWIWQIDDPGLQRYNATHEAKLSALATDCWLLVEQNLEESDIVLVDAKHMSFRILMKLNLSLSKAQVKYYEEAMPFRMNQIHFVNCPPILSRIFSIYKTFVKPEVTERICFHLPNSETLFEYINKDDLPKDLGGNRESMEYFTKLAIERIMDKREILLDDSYWISCDKNK
ncbi:retinol-binding protein pinta [Bombyx mori]|uniref:CRAL-TRIO domain-containing protein n=1 Tax=Bombyx mori TaxID=7091 RepID=A0A8R2LWG9_BOMMO|nr:uncharacterized protein LOC101740042 [Bombyx mori]XP_037868800.1 uncharacterized protein LOC101740042 [Bombyx mori]XP_037868801.1 uncharacterized protein LOC101740042 [Bombyx mori]XP_037868802.1 uncharacterized protein LOC101740042 [Bombyx mori]XP_037868803.1 uncharacterized protein LOC101740042 [Bombyx mori]